MFPSRAFLAVLLAIAIPAGASGAPPAPPGGHHPIHFGGDNRAGYPNLHQPTAVGPSGAVLHPGLVSASPNPFRSSTRIRFVTRPGERARVTVLTINGRLIREFAIGTGGGWQAIEWDGRDQRAHPCPPGVYLIRIRSGATVSSGKVVRLR